MSLRTDRRRRVWADDLLNSDLDEALPSGKEPLPNASGLRYAREALRENQMRLVDLVPLRALPFTLLFSGTVALISALLASFLWLAELAKFVPGNVLAPFDLRAQHNLATWLMSLLLLGTTQLSLIVYSVRKHRIDDYHVRYRVWLAMALVSLIAATNIAVPIGQWLDAAVAPLARWCGIAEHYGSWAALSMVMLYFTIRLTLETRTSKLAISVFALSTIAFAIPYAMGIQWLALELATHALVVSTGARLSGCLLLLTGTAAFARHVLLDVEGKLPERKPKVKKPAKVKKPRVEKSQDTDEPATTSSKSHVDPPQKPKPHIAVRTDLDTKPRPIAVPKPAPLASKPVAIVQKQDDDDEDEDDDSSSPDMRNLSRAERKRLKREAKLARRAEMAR
jgi:hypothetical protein